MYVDFNTISNFYSVDIEYDYLDQEEYQVARKTLEELPDVEKDMLKMYYGFYQGKRYKQREIVQKYHYAQPKISQIIQKGYFLSKKQNGSSISSRRKSENIC